jgi:hypothetical protein
VNAPVFSSSVEHRVPVAVQVESESMVKRTGDTPPPDEYVKLAPVATLFVAGLTQSVLVGANVMRLFAETDAA